ncbi:hypothetical protein [Nocardia sp. NPDC051570]|uniref:hypothetical protein n=1 Tax=Nocardia sp. NPDC051570 TaxID=3364324 RepID=UPI0037A0B5E7
MALALVPMTLCAAPVLADPADGPAPAEPALATWGPHTEPPSTPTNSDPYASRDDTAPAESARDPNPPQQPEDRPAEPNDAPKPPPPLATGSAIGPAPPTGSAGIDMPLSLTPKATRPTDPAADGHAEIPTAATTSGAATPVLVGPDTGSMLAGCAGSAALGGSALLAGSALGSVLLIPALYIGALGGAIVLGSGSFPLAGSGGSAAAGALPALILGSTTLGSALAGGGALTCLLAFPTVPPVPEFPLIVPPLPLGPVAAPVGAPAAPALAPPGPPVPVPPPLMPTSPVAADIELATSPPIWDTMEFVTVLIVVVILGTTGVTTSSTSGNGNAKKRRPR